MMLAATGHRPRKIEARQEYIARTRHTLADFATTCLREIHPAGVIVGMAAGWDLAVGLAALRLHIPVVAAVPFKDQYLGYHVELRADYLKVFEGANKKFLISREFDHGCFERRNKWMANSCERVLALWNGTEGGTANMVNYSREIGKPVDDVWDRWLSYRETAEDPLL